MLLKTLLCFLIWFQILQAQTDHYAGTYTFRYDLPKGEVLADTLQLYPGGTFYYSSYRNIPCAICSEELLYANGQWKASENHLIIFTADSIKGVGNPEFLNLNNTSARYLGKSKRHLGSTPVRTSVKFLRSGIFWLKGRELFRTDRP